MTALDLEQPAAAPEPGGRHRIVHLVCCRPRRSLCGTDVTGCTFAPDATPLTCSVCDAVDEAGSPCGAILCRLRQWLRQHLGRAR